MVVLFLVKLDFLFVGKRTYFGKEVIVYLELLVEGFEFLVQSRLRQLPLRGAEKPLLEERCHEVTEWWQPYTLISK